MRNSSNTSFSGLETFRMNRFFGALSLFLLSIVLAACDGGGDFEPPRPAFAAPGGAVGTPVANAPIAAETATQIRQSYRLGSGDKIRVTVFGQEDITGEYSVDAEGNVAIPLIGSVPAVNRTAVEVAASIEDGLRGDYFIDPNVSAEVIEFRPFYIYGEVSEPGEYPYVAGMTVLNAVATAGGYTYRAATRSVYVVRDGTIGEVELPASPATIIRPGDIIRVRERFF